MTHNESEHADAEPIGVDASRIVDTALVAVARGARRARLDRSAIDSVRGHFLRKIRRAVEKANWRSAWHREQWYVRAYAEDMGRYAAMLAARDQRLTVTWQDIDAAKVRMRGYMPIAGRWCPL
jgi:histone H3/H4